VARGIHRGGREDPERNAGGRRAPQVSRKNKERERRGCVVFTLYGETREPGRTKKKKILKGNTRKERCAETATRSDAYQRRRERSPSKGKEVRREAKERRSFSLRGRKVAEKKCKQAKSEGGRTSAEKGARNGRRIV